MEAEEYGARDFKRRIFRVCGIMTLLVMLAIFGIFTWAGFFPGIYRGLLTNPPTDCGLKLFIFLFVVPLS